MFQFSKPRRFYGLFPDRRGWFTVHASGMRVGFVRRESAGRWIGTFSRDGETGEHSVIAATRENAAEALVWRVRAGAEGTGEA